MKDPDEVLERLTTELDQTEILFLLLNVIYGYNGAELGRGLSRNERSTSQQLSRAKQKARQIIREVEQPE